MPNHTQIAQILLVTAGRYRAAMVKEDDKEAVEVAQAYAELLEEIAADVRRVPPAVCERARLAAEALARYLSG